MKKSFLALSLLSANSFAAATLVSEMSHLNVGTAGAGSAVLADGASTAYSNPAAMALLDDTHIALNVASMALNVEYFDDRSQAMNSDNAGGVQPYGSLYYVTTLNEKVSLGVAMAATGGSRLDYGNDYAGFLGLNDLQLSVMQLNPSLSYKLNSRWNFGAGLQVDRAVFEQRFLSNQAELKSSSFALGYNVGATYQLNDKHRIGVTYRSKMAHELEGEINARNQSLDATISLVNAARLELSGRHTIDTPVEFVWSVGQEYWSANDITSIQAGNLGLSKVRGFDDVWFASIGSKVALSPTLNLEVGVGYVSSPLQNSNQQASDLPVDSQVKYSVGAQYRWNRATQVKAYYSYVDYGSPEINSGLMKGTFDNHNQFFGIEIDYRF